MKKLKKLIKRQIDGIKIKLGLKKEITRSNQEEWRRVDQESEFLFHKNNKFRQSEAFVEETRYLLEGFDFSPSDFSEMVILDVGSGSRLRTKFFNRARIQVIEPMAERCIREIPWCDLSDAENVVSLPVEQYCDSLHESADFVFCMNVLDHCYDFSLSIENIYSYMKKSGSAFISFDSHYHTSVGHPLILTESTCKKVILEQGFDIVRFTQGFPAEYKTKYQKNGYDGNSICLNFWLKKTEE